MEAGREKTADAFKLDALGGLSGREETARKFRHPIAIETLSLEASIVEGEAIRLGR